MKERKSEETFPLPVLKTFTLPVRIESFEITILAILRIWPLESS